MSGPLSPSIMASPFPQGWSRPKLKLYEGDSDPTEHINFFVGAMQYAGASDPIYCRSFPMSLGKGLMNWFQNLPANSLHSWEAVMNCFLSQYASVKSIPKSEETLALIKQGEKESLKAFLNRFNKEAGYIPIFFPRSDWSWCGRLSARGHSCHPWTEKRQKPWRSSRHARRNTSTWRTRQHSGPPTRIKLTRLPIRLRSRETRAEDGKAEKRTRTKGSRGGRSSIATPP